MTDDEPLLWTAAEVLVHASLTSDAAAHRGPEHSLVRHAGVTLGRPLVYPISPDELLDPLRRLAEDGAVRYVGLVCAVGLDPLPPGRAYTAMSLTMTLPTTGYRSVRLRADPEVVDLLDGTTAQPWPVVGAVDGLAPGWSRHPGADEPSTDVRSLGLLSDKFSWTFDAPGRGRLTERAFVTHAVVEAPADAVELSGRLSCRVTVRRSLGKYIRSDVATMDEAMPFSEHVGRRPVPVDTGPGVRMFVSVDVENYGRHDLGGVKRTQRRLADVLDRARKAAAVAVEDHALGGDSVLFVFPPGIDEGAVLRRFYAELMDAVRVVNLDLNDHAVMRVRVGVDRGLTERAPTGWSGHVPTAVTRIRDCRAARDALAGAPQAQVALTVSDAIFRDVLNDRGQSPDPESFQRVEVTEKGFTATAWVHVGDR